MQLKWWARGRSNDGRPKPLIRLMASLLYLKHSFNLSDEELVAATTSSDWRRVKLQPVVSLGANRIGMDRSNHNEQPAASFRPG